jgi:DNA gyrase subunit A
MLITSRGIIIRQAINAISCQSRAASGVRLQRLDEDDAIVAVAIVPASDAEESDTEETLDGAGVNGELPEAVSLPNDVLIDIEVTTAPVVEDDPTADESPDE